MVRSVGQVRLLMTAPVRSLKRSTDLPRQPCAGAENPARHFRPPPVMFAFGTGAAAFRLCPDCLADAMMPDGLQLTDGRHLTITGVMADLKGGSG